MMPERETKPGLTIMAREWKKLEPIVAEAGAVLDVDFLRRETRMTRTKVTALLLLMHMNGAATLFWLVYHCSDDPVAKRRFENGFQPVPWRCPDCDEEVVHRESLRYEVQAVLRRPLDKRELIVIP
jgi:hypothetical protein